MMSQLTGDERARYVHNIFSRISKRYNLMNRLMTGGQDIRWRRKTIQRAKLAPGNRLLDLGTGTGDLGREALRQQPAIRLVAADFNREMMLAGQASDPLPWLNADALHLPFTEKSFEAVVSGFLMRNVGNLSAALQEQYRILKKGGRIVILETTRPQAGFFSPFVRIYMRIVIPLIGGLVSGEREAYRYLPASSESFLSAERLADAMDTAGFQEVGYQCMMFGTVAIHWGRKSN